MRNEIKKLLERALKELNFDVSKIKVDYPKNEAFGDYSTNVAMLLARLDSRKRPLVDARRAKTAKKNPMEIANKINSQLTTYNLQQFEKIEIAKPGYINFYLSAEYLQKKVEEINKLKDKFGESRIGKGIKVNNEFISANPTGPLHLGNGRGGFLGDTISKVLKKCGFDVTNEYYINDAGEQVIKLGHSVLKDNEAEYSGKYIDDLRKRFKDIKEVKEAGEKSAKVIMDEMIKKTIAEKMEISFDSWISEKEDLYDKGKVEEAIKKLGKNKLAYKKDGALWLETTKFGDEKDRVLIKSDSEKTYFASDCGYILSKVERKFDKLIEIWGADHHGYVLRFKAAAEALGFKGNLRFIIIQLVRLVKDGKEVRMSKRAGDVVYIDELIDKVGRDVARFFFLMYSPDTHMNFDLGLAEEKSEKNPVYYVQYAHARISSILEKSKVYKVEGDLKLLTQEKELDLVRELNKFPEIIQEISQSYETHRLPYYAIRLADKFHSFYNDLTVLDPENLEVSAARLKLVNAVKIVLAEALRLMGVSAPVKM